MLSVQLGMDVPKQRRKITHRLEHASTLERAVYLAWLLGHFDACVWLGIPRPASEFLPMYEEEFGPGM